MADPAKRRATYEDVLAAPENMIAEIIDGELSLSPRPAKRHTAAATALGEELGPPFKRGRGGPGGWILLDEPELHFDDDVLLPDLGGRRRERMPVMTNDEPTSRWRRIGYARCSRPAPRPPTVRASCRSTRGRR